MYLFLLSGVRREALNQVCFDETETSEETSVRIAQLSDFYGFTTNLLSNHPNAELSLARAHHRSCAREGVTRDYDAFVIDQVADNLVSGVSRRRFDDMQSLVKINPKTLSLPCAGSLIEF